MENLFYIIPITPLLVIVWLLWKSIKEESVVFYKQGGDEGTCCLETFKYEIKHIPPEGVGIGVASDYSSPIYKNSDKKIWAAATNSAEAAWSKGAGSHYIIFERDKDGNLILHAEKWFIENVKSNDRRYDIEVISMAVFTNSLKFWWKLKKARRKLPASIERAKNEATIKDVIT